MVLAILQARTSSTRLPGKVMLPIEGEPMLARQVERIRRSRKIDQLIVATSTDSSDDVLAELCGGLNVPCFRGSLDDVLDRFYQAAAPYRPEWVVRLTGDCPLADPELIDQVISEATSGGHDYVNNCNPPTYPDGLDVEVFSFRCLEEAWRDAKLPSEREHVTVFIRNCGRYKVANVEAERDLSALRWTVDENDDYTLVCRIYGALYAAKPDFSTTDILAYLEEHPTLKSLNTCHARNEGLAISIAKDQKVLAQHS